MRKLTLLLAVGVGYVLGAAAGRQRYEQIKNAAFRVKEDPRVQSAASTVADTAKGQAPVVAQKVSQAAGAAASAAAARSPFGGSSDSDTDRDELLEQLDPESTARQDDPYPKGDLP
jgi:L-aminopeptidase/D-esterase-like protein